MRRQLSRRVAPWSKLDGAPVRAGPSVSVTSEVVGLKEAFLESIAAV
jgi:hypothetical protein